VGWQAVCFVAWVIREWRRTLQRGAALCLGVQVLAVNRLENEKGARYRLVRKIDDAWSQLWP
jgi:hypothetical protein